MKPCLLCQFRTSLLLILALGSSTQPLFAAVSLVRATSSDIATNNLASRSLSIDATGLEMAVACVQTVCDGDETVFHITFDDVAMTPLPSGDVEQAGTGTDTRMQCFYYVLPTPIAGERTVNVQFAGPVANSQIGLFGLAGVDPAAPILDSENSQAAANGVDVTLTTDLNGCLVIWASAIRFNGTLNPNSSPILPAQAATCWARNATNMTTKGWSVAVPDEVDICDFGEINSVALSRPVVVAASIRPSSGHTVTFTTDGTPGASITGNIAQSVPEGGNCTLVTANPPASHDFLHWTNGPGGPEYALTPGIAPTNITAPATYVAVFSPKVFPITVSAGTHGTIQPGTTQQVSYGGTAGFVITAGSGCHITSITFNGEEAGSPPYPSPFSYTTPQITQASTLEAAFAPDNTPPSAITPDSLTINDNDPNGTEIACLNVYDEGDTTPFVWSEIGGDTAAFALGSPTGFTVPLLIENTSLINRGVAATLSYRIRVTDAAGAVYEATLHFQVMDTTPPEITACPPPQLLSVDDRCHAGMPDLAAAFSTHDNAAIATINQQPSPGTAMALGAASVVFTVTDTSGNTAQCETALQVCDDAPPRLEPRGGVTANVPLGTPFVDPGAQAFDNCSVSATPSAVVVAGDPAFDTAVNGNTWTIEYRVNDNAGNPALPVQTLFTVRADTTPPIIEGIDQPIQLHCAQPLESAMALTGVSAVDGNEGSVAVSVDLGMMPPFPSPDTAPYSIRYWAQDSLNNQTEAQRTVLVLDDCPLAAIPVGDTSIQAPLHSEIRLEIAAVDAAGTLHVQWFFEPQGKSPTPIQDANDVLYVFVLEPETAGEYYAVITDQTTSVTSDTFDVALESAVPSAGWAGWLMAVAFIAATGCFYQRCCTSKPR